MWTKIYRELFWMGFSKEQYEQVKGPIEEENRRSVVAWSIGAGLFWIFSLAMSLKSDAYRTCRVVYLVALRTTSCALVACEDVLH